MSQKGPLKSDEVLSKGYDSEVARVFGFTYPNEKGMEKFDRYSRYYGELTRWVDFIQENPAELSEAFHLFDEKFSKYGIPRRRAIDFILWSEGKLMK